MCQCLERYIDNWITLLRICEDFQDDFDKDVRKIVCDIAIKRNAEDLLAILKPISTALNQMQSNSCDIADAVVIWKTLQQSLDKVLSSKKLDIFLKRYRQALTPAHFLAYILTPLYINNSSASIRLSADENEVALKLLKVFETDGQLLSKILKFQIGTEPFQGIFSSNNIIQQLSSIEWWYSVNKMKHCLDDDEIRIIKQLLSATASSAGIERIFSTFGFVQSKLRNQLGLDKAAKLVFLYKLLNK